MIALVLALLAQQELLERYALAKTWDERKVIAERLDRVELRSVDVASLTRECFRLARRGPLVDHRPRQTCTDPALPGEYLLHVPNAARSKPCGIFIGLHGGGAGVGDGTQAQTLFGTPAPDLICVYPTVIAKTDGAWLSEREERYVLAIIDELKRSYTIDTNRIYLAGFSMGGFGAWSIGGRHADLFAALSSLAGGVDGSGMIPNLRNTPIWFCHSRDDTSVAPDGDMRAAARLAKLKEQFGAFDHVWKLYRDVGHGLPEEGVKPVLDWMLARKRDPLPKRVVWEGSRAYKRHFYWLKRDAPGRLVDARIDGNVIEITGDAAGLEILLNDRLVDLDRDVTIRVNGEERFRGLARLSLATLAESISVRSDPEMVFTSSVRVAGRSR